jgi:hypothetical protein
MVAVADTSSWTTPRQSIEAECGRRGRSAVVAACVELLERRAVDPELIVVLGGPPARWALDADGRGGPDYWLRVWAVRGLLWAWEDSARPAVLRALDDEAWRVREMAVKVLARNGVGEAVRPIAELQSDPSSRVRAEAARALRRLTTAHA